MKPKNKYKGTFNWHGEIYIFYRYAHSEQQAKELMTSAIAFKLGLLSHATRNYFSGNKDSYKVEKI